MKANSIFIAVALFAACQTSLAGDVSHSYDYGPDVGDKFGSGASFDYEALGTGYLGLKNPTGDTVSIKTSQTDGAGTPFNIKAKGHVCFTFSGYTHFDVSGKGYVEITEDSTLSDIPHHCKNYFGLAPGHTKADSTEDAAELIKAGIDILGAIGDE